MIMDHTTRVISMENIAKDTHVSPKTVYHVIRRLFPIDKITDYIIN